MVIAVLVLGDLSLQNSLSLKGDHEMSNGTAVCDRGWPTSMLHCNFRVALFTSDALSLTRQDTELKQKGLLT